MTTTSSAEPSTQPPYWAVMTSIRETGARHDESGDTVSQRVGADPVGREAKALGTARIACLRPSPVRRDSLCPSRRGYRRAGRFQSGSITLYLVNFCPG